MVSTNGNKLLWHYVKSLRQDSTALKDSTNGQITKDTAGRANILNNHFKLVSTVESNESFPNKGPSPYPTIPNFTISEGVKVTSLTNIFQSSLNSGTAPSQWKHAYVSTIFKKGNRSDAKNYRPISLVSHGK